MKTIVWIAVSVTALTATLVLGIFLGRTYFNPTPPITVIKSSSSGYPVPQQSVATFKEVHDQNANTVHEKRLADIQRAGEMDAEGLVAEILAMASNPEDRRSYTQRLPIYLDSLVSLGPEQALNLLSGDANERLKHMLFQSWLAQDFEAAAAYFISNPSERKLGSLLLNTPELTHSPSQNAVATAFGPEADERLRRLRFLEMDPLQALEQMLTSSNLSTTGDRIGLLHQLANRLSADNFSYGIEMAKTMTQRNERRRLYSALIQNAARQDPEKTFQTLRQQFEGHPDRSRVMREFAQHAPASAEQFILDYARTNQDYTLLINHLAKIARQDTQRAMDLYREIPAGVLPRNEINQFAHQIGNGQPDAVYNWVKQLSKDDVQTKQDVLMQLAHQNYQFLENKLQTETDPQMRSGVLAMVISQRANADPIQALEMIDEFSDDNSRIMLTQRVTQQWANQNPRELINYAVEQQDENLTRSINHAAQSWYYKEPQAALEFVSGIEDNEIRARAQYGLINSMLNQDPDRAVQIANSLPAKYRDRARYEVTIGLIRTHRGEMEKIITGMNLDPVTAQRVREYVETNM